MCYNVDPYLIMSNESQASGAAVVEREPLPVQSIGRAAALLRSLAAAGPTGLGLREAAAAVGLKPTTTHSLLRSLRAEALVEQERGTGRYRLGMGLLRLAGAYLEGHRFLLQLEPVLQELHRETAETVQLGVLHGDRHHTVRVLLSPQPVVAAPARIDAPRLHCTALGKVLLAFSPLELCRRLVDGIEARGFPAFSPATITTRRALEAELERVRAQGVASNYEEGRPGVIGQAAPVFDYSGAVVAAIGLAYPALRRTPTYDCRMIEAVRRAGREASQRLGWRG
jgi:DNA-binding IclR family transcriptional regulator